MGSSGRRLITAGAALVALGALLVGVPWFLLRFTDAAHLLRADWGAALTLGADSQLLLALLSAVAWAAWAVVALTVVFEVVAVLSRQRIRLALPGTQWLRPAVGALVMAAVAAPTVAVADAAPPPLAAQLPPAPVTAAAEPGIVTATSGHVAGSGRTYTVQPGDELWSVAERELGSGERWRDIVALNDGLSDVTRLNPGDVLTLPVDAPPPAPTVVVQEGDTLWHIAGAELDDPTRWPELHRANADVIADPDVIEVGWELRLPQSAAEPVASEPAAPAPAPASATESQRVEAEQEPEEAEPVRADPEQPAAQSGPAGSAEVAVEEAFGWGFPVEADPVAETAPPEEVPPAPELETAEDEDSVDYSGMLQPVGAALAGSVLLGVATRRRAQLLARAVGRRLIPVPDQVARFWTAMAQHAEDAEPTSSASGPTTVVLGWAGDEPIQVDVEAERALLFAGTETQAALGALITELTCTPTASGTELIVVGSHDWVTALDDPRVTAESSVDAGLHRLARLCSERRLAMRQGTLASMRADDNLADAFAPTVVVFLEPLGPAHLDALGDALALGEVGVSVLAPAVAPAHLPYAQVHVGPDQAALRGRTFQPQLVTAPARRALLELFTATGRADTEPAPWWGATDLPPNVRPLPRLDRPEEQPMTTLLNPPPHPVLSVLGPVQLSGATGAAPTRAVGQCMEYCAWLLQHPGATPTRMLLDLQVADATRRSNMSRLRTWLGADQAGLPYLPDAYSGRIRLDERVTSDWEQFTAILSGGVNLASNQALRDALTLVRGEPLGAFAFQWHWAQQLRADMVAMIVDAACVLADRSLEQGNLDAALWAIARGRLGAPADDALAVREIEALTAAGRRADAEHAVVRLNRTLRADGRDLEPSLALRVQDSLQSPARRVLSE